MNRLLPFLSSWPVQIPLWTVVVIVVVWPEETWHWLRTLAFVEFLIAYIG